MSLVEQGRLADGITSLTGGMDSGRSPSTIDPNQCAYAENISFRGGYATTRPGFKRIQFASSVAASAFTDTGGESDQFQGASYFDYSTGQIVAVVGGNTYKLEPPSSGDEWSVTDITNSITMSTTAERGTYLFPALLRTRPT